MNIFISGGCKNGKSHHAQELARNMSREKSLPLYYLATMIPCDDEDRARIRRHLSEREGWGFETIEQGRDICRALDGYTLSGEKVSPKGVFLLDSVTALLSNEMFPPGGEVSSDAGDRLAAELSEFARRTGNTIFDSYTENYRRALAHIDRTLAALCDQVIEVSFGFKYMYK